jgi:flagellar biogenesis protein FliO
MPEPDNKKLHEDKKLRGERRSKNIFLLSILAIIVLVVVLTWLFKR